MARFLLALLLLPLVAHAQQREAPPQEATPGPSTLSVNVRVVAFDAILRDRNNVLLHDVPRENLTLLVDGQPLPLRYFSEDNDLPLTIGLMVDTSGSQRQYFVEQRIASQTFLTNMLTAPQDDAFLLRFDENVLLLQRLTRSLPLLENALGKLSLKYPPMNGPAAGTLLFDSLCAMAHHAFTLKSGTAAEPAATSRRAVVILTDGEDNGSRKTRDEGIECALRAGITIYVALYSSRGDIVDERFDPRVHVFPREFLPGRTNAERIARSTGGRVFVVSHSLPIATIYSAIQAELRSQYRLGFTPPADPPGSYHTLELKPADKRMKVQTRSGYYAP